MNQKAVSKTKALKEPSNNNLYKIKMKDTVMNQSKNKTVPPSSFVSSIIEFDKISSSPGELSKFSDQ